MSQENQERQELIQESLFSSKVRTLVDEYKLGILELEQQIQQVVQENFKYLDMPEGGRITGIVEKHLANMSAEIMGIKQDLTHFEISQLHKANRWNFVMLMRPVGVTTLGGGIEYQGVYDNSDHNPNNNNRGWNDDYNHSIYNGYHSNCYWRGATYNRVEYEASLYSNKADSILSISRLFQPIAMHLCEEIGRTNRSFEAIAQRIWRTSGSGSITNRGVWKTTNQFGDREGHRHTHFTYGGYGLPESGFYVWDPNWQNFLKNINRHLGREGGNLKDGMIMRRCNSDGSLTNEANSELRLKDSAYFNERQFSCGDFVGIHGSSYHHSRNHAYTFDEMDLKSNIIRYIISTRWGQNMDPRVFFYYWSWQDELGNEQDIANVKDILNFWYEAQERQCRIPSRSVDDPLPFRRNERLPYEVWLPKGERHMERMLTHESAARYNRGKRYFNFTWEDNKRKIIEGGIEKDGGLINDPGYLRWRPKHFGLTPEEQREDREWLRGALERGEPVLDWDTHCHKYAGNLLECFKIWGRFYQDQKRYHTAEALAKEPGASQATIDNYLLIKRWYYTKWDAYRNKQGTEQVELLSSKIMQVVESMLQ